MSAFGKKVLEISPRLAKHQKIYVDNKQNNMENIITATGRTNIFQIYKYKYKYTYQ